MSPKSNTENDGADHTLLIDDKSILTRSESSASSELGQVHAIITRSGTNTCIPIYITDEEAQARQWEKHPRLHREENYFCSKSNIPQRRSKCATFCFIMTILIIIALAVIAVFEAAQVLQGPDFLPRHSNGSKELHVRNETTAIKNVTSNI